MKPRAELVWCKDCEHFAWCYTPVYHGVCGTFKPISSVIREEGINENSNMDNSSM